MGQVPKGSVEFYPFVSVGLWLKTLITSVPLCTTILQLLVFSARFFICCSITYFNKVSYVF